MASDEIFKTFEDVKEFIEKLKDEFHPLRIKCSASVDQYNKKLKNPEKHLPAEILYSYIIYVCKHYGSHRSRGSGIRVVQRVLPSSCPYFIHFTYQRAVKGFMVTKQNTQHNHEIGEHLYSHYAENRKLTDGEKEDVLEMLEAGTKPFLLRNVMEAKTSKVILTKDLHNLCSVLKNKNISEHKNIAYAGGEFLKSNPGSEFIIVLDDEGKQLEMLFLQSQSQKLMYDAFGEVLQVDATYQTSNTGMPLFEFVVEDSNGRSVVVGYCLAASERKFCASTMLDLFKGCNAGWEKTKLILVDEDFSEIGALTDHFPDAKICLCLFHMMRDINTKVNSLNLESKVKENLLASVKKIIFCTIEEDLCDYIKSLKWISEVFHEYFVDSWFSCKERWSPVYQKGMLTLMNSTRNRVEAHHRRLKEHMSTSKSLSEALNILIDIMSSNSNVVTSHRQFRDKLYTTVVANGDPDIQDYFTLCTTYAAELISSEHSASLSPQYTISTMNGEMNVATAYHVHKLTHDVNRCSCLFNVRLNLPCRHLFSARRVCMLPAYCEDMVSERFKKGYAIAMLKEFSVTETNVRVIIPPKSTKKLTRPEKYKKTLELIQKIATTTSELTDHDYHCTIKSLEKVLDCIQNREVMIISCEETHYHDTNSLISALTPEGMDVT